MPRNVKSQWEFGELFEAAATRQVLTVSELTVKVRRLLEQQIGEIWITGEVSNLRVHSSGHAYFCLKDRNAQLQCVLFRDEARGTRDLLADGQMVILGGEITVYEARGQYQLRVTKVELQGAGALQVAFEKLKKKLQAEGLFDPQRKRPLPRYPQRIGIVTSPTGAALRDVLHVIERRQPGLEIVLAPCRVQGSVAGAEIAAAIRGLNEWHRRAVGEAPAGSARMARGLDLILITRGGGSLEDLWAFNEEAVARAVFESALPIVSAVGHEIDFTISDFVADLRAATPSAAAELITAGPFASLQYLEETRGYLLLLVRRRIEHDRQALAKLAVRYGRCHPRRRLREKFQALDDAQAALVRCTRYNLRHQQRLWTSLAQRLARLRPALIVGQRRQAVIEVRRRLIERVRRVLEERGHRLAHAGARLRLLSPFNVLDRGYSITRDAGTGAVLRSRSDARAGQQIETQVKEGIIRSVVES